MFCWQKRYQWKLADKGCWRHYLIDISVFVELIKYVMRDIQRYGGRSAGRGSRNSGSNRLGKIVHDPIDAVARKCSETVGKHGRTGA